MTNMSGKAFKQKRNEEETKKAESITRQQAFIKEVQALSSKYRVDMIPVIQYKNTGLVPAITLIDVKEKYEHMTEEAKKAEEMKNQAQNGKVNPTEPAVDSVQKLEL